VPEGGIAGIEEEHGPSVYAVLRRESAPIELVSRLTARYLCPFHGAHGEWTREPGIFYETGCSLNQTAWLSFFHTTVFRLSIWALKPMIKSALP
jgi:hypothetical protein